MYKYVCFCRFCQFSYILVSCKCLRNKYYYSIRQHQHRIRRENYQRSCSMYISILQMQTLHMGVPKYTLSVPTCILESRHGLIFMCSLLVCLLSSLLAWCSSNQSAITDKSQIKFVFGCLMSSVFQYIQLSLPVSTRTYLPTHYGNGNVYISAGQS